MCLENPLDCFFSSSGVLSLPLNHDCHLNFMVGHHIYMWLGLQKQGVCTNYTLSHNRSFHCNRTEYFDSVTCITWHIKFLIRGRNFMTIGDNKEKLWVIKFGKEVKFYVPTCPVFAGPVNTLMHFEHYSCIISSTMHMVALWCYL